MRKRLFFLTSILLVSGLSLFGQESAAEIQNPGVIRSFWQLTSYAQEFRWPLNLTFIIGIILGIAKAVDLVFDWLGTRRFARADFSKFGTPEQIAAFAREKRSPVSDLVLHLLMTLDTAPDGSRFTEELETYVQNRKQMFQTFRARMAFWSDTAGALGLLGTVWGMFVTFFRGTMEPQEILSGMGIALVTTLMGLVISIVLNFIATEVGSLFNRILDRYGRIAQRLWERMRHESAAIPAAPVREAAGHAPVHVPAKEARQDVWYQLVLVSGDKQKVMQGATAKSALAVRLIQIKQGRKKKMAGESIRFSCDECGKFQNGAAEVAVKTDDSGKAEAFFTAVAGYGRCRVEAKHSSLPVPPLVFELEIQGSVPAQIRGMAGDNQSAHVGRPLANPLVVQVMDGSGGPVANCPVRFRVTMGDGKFANHKDSLVLPTDDQGKAKAALTLGTQTGFYSVEAEAEGLAGKKVTFKALGQ